jgi:hypothetical protein
MDQFAFPLEQIKPISRLFVVTSHLYQQLLTITVALQSDCIPHLGFRYRLHGEQQPMSFISLLTRLHSRPSFSQLTL